MRNNSAEVNAETLTLQEISMKKLMTLMLGLSLVLGSTTLFGKSSYDHTKKERKAKKNHKTKVKK